MQAILKRPARIRACLMLGMVTTLPAWAEEAAVELGAAYTGDVMRNVDGGIRTGGTYLDNLDITLAVDGERLWGATGLELYAHALYNNSSTFSDRYVGDAFIVSSIDTDRAIRLYEAWVQWTFGRDAALSVKTGLYDLNSEFDTTPARGLFVNSVYGIGQDFAQTGQNGPSIFPATALAIRGAWAVSETTQVKLAVLDGVPGDPDDPSRTRIDLSSEDGALIAGEFTTARGRMTQLTVGYWRYTADFEDLLETDPLGAPRRRDDNQGAYITAEFALTDSAAAFVRAGIANRHVNAFDRFYAAGAAWNGPLANSDDQLGIAISAARASQSFRASAGPAGSIDSHEYNVELTWRIPVTDWLTLQPDVQYIVNPGLDASLRDSLVLGLRFELAGSWPIGGP